MNINKVTEIINQKGYEAEIKEVVKGSATKTGIQVGSGSIRPVIYPETILAETDEEMADKVIELYETNKTPNFDVNQLMDAEYIKKNMFVSVRRPIEDDSFTKSFLDIQLVIRVRVDEKFTFRLTKAAAERFEFDESIFDKAIKNMKFEMKSLGVICEEMTGESHPDAGLYVLSNAERSLGAAAIYDKEGLKAIAEELDSDLIIIPSSIHELIVLKCNIEDIPHLNQMVVDVNRTQVIPEEQLSDHVYIYEKETGIIKY